MALQEAALLGSFIIEQENRIVRRASRSLRHDLVEGLSREQRKTAIPSYASELGSLLLERGEEGPRLWGEAVRKHGRLHFQYRHEIGDLLREFQALETAVVEEWGKRLGSMSLVVQLLLSECMTEGAAAAASDYVREVRSEQVAFRESALIETILEHLDEGILLTEADGIFSYATRPAFDLLGEGLRSAIGQPLVGPEMGRLLSALKAVGPDGEPLNSGSLPTVATLHTGRSPGVMLAQVHRLGEERFLEIGAIPIWDDDRPGDPRRDLRGVITTVRDRTEARRKSEQLRQKSRELAELHSRMLRRSRTQAMGELAGGTAHALNNVLNAMHLRLTLLREAPGPETVDSLGRSVNELADLVSRLQKYAASKPSGPIQSAFLDSAVRDALALVRPEARRAGEGIIHVRSKLSGPPAVRANDTELSELLVSLLLYARDAIDQGGELEVQTCTAGEAIECRIRYWGQVEQRPEALLAPLLESDADPQLGLAVGGARDMLRGWGGALGVTALETGGVEITLRFLPAAAEFKPPRAPPPPAPAAPQPAERASGRRVLVIDDDVDNANMLAEVLESEGYDTDTANTGEEAIGKWEAGRFDVALIDLVMPDMPGTEIAAALRATRPHARLALVTGWELDEEQRRTAPVHDVFRKPVDLSQLLAFLEPPDEPRPEAPA